MRALVLSGGADKGAYQVGALKKWMFEDGTDYDIITGISVGAINSAYLCQTPIGQPKEAWSALNALWNQVSDAKVKKSWLPLFVIEALWKQSVYNSAPLQQWIKSGLDPKKVASSGKQLRVVAVSWDSGESRVATQDTPNIPDWVIASSAFPVMLSPITIDGQLWADGGLRSVTPLGEAIRAGATEIDVIQCSDPYAKDDFASKGKAAIPGLAIRAIDILTDEIMRADLKICGLKNDLVEAGGPYKKVAIRRVLSPSVKLVENDLDFSQPTIQRMMKIGYDDACKMTAP